MKKAQIIPLAGVVALVISISIVAIISFLDANKHISVVSKSEELISFLHYQELLNKELPESIPYLVEYYFYKNAKNGFDFDEWTTDSPTYDDILTIINDSLENRLSKISGILESRIGSRVFFRKCGNAKNYANTLIRIYYPKAGGFVKYKCGYPGSTECTYCDYTGYKTPEGYRILYRKHGAGFVPVVIDLGSGYGNNRYVWCWGGYYTGSCSSDIRPKDPSKETYFHNFQQSTDFLGTFVKKEVSITNDDIHATAKFNATYSKVLNFSIFKLISIGKDLISTADTKISNDLNSGITVFTGPDIDYTDYNKIDNIVKNAIDNALNDIRSKYPNKEVNILSKNIQKSYETKVSAVDKVTNGDFTSGGTCGSLTGWTYYNNPSKSVASCWVSSDVVNMKSADADLVYLTQEFSVSNPSSYWVYFKSKISGQPANTGCHGTYGSCTISACHRSYIRLSYIDSGGKELGNTTFFYYDQMGFDPRTCGRDSTDKWIKLDDTATSLKWYEYKLSNILPSGVDITKISKIKVKIAEYNLVHYQTLSVDRIFIGTPAEFKFLVNSKFDVGINDPNSKVLLTSEDYDSTGKWYDTLSLNFTASLSHTLNG